MQLLVCLLLLALFSSVSGQLSRTLSADVVSSIRSNALAEIASPQSAKSVYFGAKVLDADELKKACNCKVLNDINVASETYSQAIYGQLACSACSCEYRPVSRSANSLTGDDLSAHALEGVEILTGGNRPSDNYESKLVSLMSGAIRRGGSVQYAPTCGVKAVLALLAEGLKLSEEIKVKVVELAASAFGQANEDGVSDPEFYLALKTLGAKTSLKPRTLLATTEALISYASSNCLVKSVSSLKDLELLSAVKAPPLHVSLVSSRFMSTDKVVLNVQVQSVLGEPIANVPKLDIKHIKKNGKGRNFYMQEHDNSLSVDLSAQGLGVGRYEVSTELSDGRAKPVPVKLFFTIVASASIGDVAVSVNKGYTISKSQMVAVAKEHGYTGPTVHVKEDSVVHVAFSVRSVEAPGVVPSMLNVCFEGDTVQHCVAAKEIDSMYHAALPMSERAKQFNHASGEYRISIYVGDIAYSSSVEFKVGTISFTFIPKMKVIEPLYTKALLDESDRTLSPLPEIQHVMRPPPVLAPIATSLVFGALPLVILAGFTYFALFKTGLTLSGAAASSLAFLGCIGTFIILIISFWLGLPGVSFYETISYICFLAPITFIVGYASL